jgi:hypothetical protein
VTWTRRSGGYDLLFNRDELLTRKEAAPPRIHTGEGVRWIAPVDGDHGGSWVTANESGVTLALLNGRPDPEESDPEGFRSRGLLLADLAPAADLEEAGRRLHAQDLSVYRSFRLVAVVSGRSARLLEWDGSRLTADQEADRRLPIVSSSFEETEVGEARRREYERITGLAPGAPEYRDLEGTGPSRATPPPGAPRSGQTDIRLPTLERLLAFHRSRRGGPNAYTVAMRRAEAATRSFTRITMDAEEAVMRYAPGLPRADAPEYVMRLPLVSRSE